MLGALVGRVGAVWAGVRVRRFSLHSIANQKKWFRRLIKAGTTTLYGREVGLPGVEDYEHYRTQVPLVTYEDLLPWIERIKNGEMDVLWRGLPLYFAKTSGTTAGGAKLIPLTAEMLRCQVRAAAEVVFNWVRLTGRYDIFNGKMLYLSGSPEVEYVGCIPSGRLSGIVHRHVPWFVRSSRLPSMEANMIEKWEDKLRAIIREVLAVREQLTLISGIPPWIEMFLEWVEAETGRRIVDVFPRLTLYVHGGVQFEPYRLLLRKYLPQGQVHFLETFPASEGFIGYQDVVETQEKHPGLLLLTDHGIFYEFIPLGEATAERPSRLPLWEIEEGRLYEVVLTTNAGLWAYRLGDVVRVVSVEPVRVVVVGRTSQYISAFGEHVIIEEVEKAIAEAARHTGAIVKEFTVAPQVAPTEGGRPYHEWFVEFEQAPEDIELFARILDDELQRLNPYYRDLVSGGILRRAVVRVVRQGAFREYLSSIGRLGGQNKVPRLANDRRHADPLVAYIAGDA